MVEISLVATWQRYRIWNWPRAKTCARTLVVEKGGNQWGPYEPHFEGVFCSVGHSSKIHVAWRASPKRFVHMGSSRHLIFRDLTPFVSYTSSYFHVIMSCWLVTIGNSLTNLVAASFQVFPRPVTSGLSHTKLVDQVTAPHYHFSIFQGQFPLLYLYIFPLIAAWWKFVACATTSSGDAKW